MSRALHWCLKIGDRVKSIQFYRDILGMTVLRHEEFDEGCKATCNGPYQNAWSKTMIGYGPESGNFILELTYNYPIPSYGIGNDLRKIVIESTTALEGVKKEFNLSGDEVDVKDPDGYPLIIRKGNNSLTQVSISVSNLSQSIDYWSGLLGLKVYTQSSNEATLGYADDQCKLNLVHVGAPIDHATGWGRLAFGVPSPRLLEINEIVKKRGLKILHDLVTLSTPGKSDVHVVILLDPDDYEICFVGAENFAELAAVDPEADKILNQAMADEAAVWKKRGGRDGRKEE